MSQLTLSLLGPLQIRLDDRPLTGLAYHKVRALLAYLAVEARPHGRDALSELLWPGQPSAAARRSLRVALATLRQALTAPIPFLIASRESLQVNRASDISLDLTAFDELLRGCAQHAHPIGALCDECVTRMSQAVALYRGEFLQQLEVRDSVAFDEWVMLWRERLQRAALEALAQLASHHEAQGQDKLARQYAWRTLALEGWDEAAHRCVMRVLARNGQRSAALAQYERCRKVLADELGVEPSAETRALYEQIRTHSSKFYVSKETDSNSELRTQNSKLQAQLTAFIGREAELAQLAELLADPACRLLTIGARVAVAKRGWLSRSPEDKSERTCTASPLSRSPQSALLSSSSPRSPTASASLLIVLRTPKCSCSTICARKSCS
jgi:DNA-binding SARP family transcriptional activator